MIYKCFFSEDWKNWISANLEAKCPKPELFTILLNHGFDYDMVASALEYQPTDQLTFERRDRQSILLAKEDTIVVSAPNKALSDNHNVKRLDTALADVYFYDNFLSAEECATIIKKMEKNLTASTVTDPKADKSTRTSSTSHLDCRDSDIDVLERKIHNFMGIGLEFGEEIQGQRYLIGQEFKTHTDYFDANATYNTIYMDRGQRTWTFMVYLDDCEEGGATRFTRLNVDYKPKTGGALIWNNQQPDGNGNPYTEHSGMPVVKGQKNVITKWFREKSIIRSIS
jgi:prolyl 4-hydroxylase